MATNEGKKAFFSPVAIAAYLMVMLNADNTVSVHDGVAANGVLGCTEYAQLDDYCGVVLCNTAGTREIMAAGVIDIKADVVCAADGRIVALPAGAGDYLKVGTALEAATADGDIIEILPCDPVVITVT